MPPSFVTCPSCQTRLEVSPQQRSGPRHCPRCGVVIDLPGEPDGLLTGQTLVHPAPPAPAAGVPAHSQWFVSFSDGRTVGPLTGEQLREAIAHGKVPAEARVRRGDWSQAVPHAQLLRQAADAAPQRESYLQQLGRNPVGTMLFGPQLPVYQGAADSPTRARRKRHFLWWVYGVAALSVLAVLVPFLAGIARGNLQLAVGAAGLGLFWLLWPLAFYGLGMLMYAGALFEWQMFFQSRRVRGVRALFGDAGARRMYLGLGGALMGGAGLVSLGGTAIIGLGMLIGDAGPKRTAAPARRLGAAERQVTERRRELADAARAVAEPVARIRELEAEIRRRPNDMQLRADWNAASDTLRQRRDRYVNARNLWEQDVQNLKRLAGELNATSETLERNRALPAELDFNRQQLEPAERFPVREVAGKLRLLEQAENQFGELANQPADNEAALIRVAERIDQLRAELTRDRRDWGVGGDLLKQPPARARLEQLGIRPENGSAARGIPRAVGAGETRLLRAFTPSSSVIRGKARVELQEGRRILVTDALGGPGTLVHLPVELPPWYEVEAEVTRLEGTGPCFFVLPIEGHPAALVIDGAEQRGARTGLVLDGQALASPRYRGKVLLGQQLPLGETIRLMMRVRQGKLQLAVNGEVRFEWEDQLGRLILPPFYLGGRPRDLCTGSFQSRFRIERLVARRVDK